MTISFAGSQGTIATAAAMVTVSEGTMAAIAVVAVVTVALVVAVSMLILVVEDRVCLATNWSRCCK